MRAHVKGVAGAIALAGVAAGVATPANAFLFWNKTEQVLMGPASGGEAGITQPLAGAKPNEQLANLVWTMRAGLNVAALQCQFAPTLRTVSIYNNMLRQHSAELQTSYTALTAYFKRVAGAKWANAMDQYTTRTYNGFSTLNAQLGFCETAASIGRETLERPRGELNKIATARMREFRAALVPRGDQIAPAYAGSVAVPNTDFGVCFDKKGRAKNKC
jgi:hypothetical protein